MDSELSENYLNWAYKKSQEIQAHTGCPLKRIVRFMIL